MNKKTMGSYFKSAKYYLFFMLFLSFGLWRCDGNFRTNEAIETWEMYVQTIKEGNSEQARNFWTKESQKYFVPESELERFWLDQKITIVKAESSGDVVKLQLLAEKDGQQRGFFSYLVRQNGKYLLQYPFLIFAQSWPTMKSRHFIIHSLFLPDSKYSEPDKNTNFPDTTVLEEFLAKIQRLTGIQYPGTIDYYLCHDRKIVAELAGRRKAFPRYSIGSCAVTCEKYSFPAITDIVTKGYTKPTELIYRGLLGYSDFERALTEKGDIERANYTTADHLKKLGEHPLLSLAESQGMKIDRDRNANLWIVGGAMVDLLIAEGGEDKFRELYESSGTEQSFEKSLSTIYNTDLGTLEKKLQEKYK